MKKLFPIIVLLTLAHVSCNRDLLEQKRNDKAVQRVLNHVDLTNKVGTQWEKNNPCINDTVTRVDTIRKRDTTLIPPIQVPCEQNFHGKTEDGIEVTILGGYLSVKVPDNYNVVEIKTEKTVEDVRRLNIALDSVNYYKGVVQQKQGIIDEKEKQIVALSTTIDTMKEERKSVSANLDYLWRSLTRKWWFWALIVGTLAFILRKLWIPRIPFLSNLLNIK